MTAASVLRKSVFPYYAIAAIILLIGFVAPTKGGEFATSPPIFVSLLLLVPLFVYQRQVRRKHPLQRAVGEKQLGSLSLQVTVLFVLAMSIRVPSVLLFGEPYEKTPLIYLLVLTILLVEKTDLVAFGFKTEKMLKSLLTGTMFFLVFAGVSLALSYFLISVFTQQMPVQSFDFASSLLVMPFMTFCVGLSEEAFFRGYMQTQFERHYGFIWAIVIQAVFFGLWHFIWNLSPFDATGMGLYVASTFLTGLLFGYLYYKTRSLVPVVFAHGLLDSIPPWIVENSRAIDSFLALSTMHHIFVLTLSSATAAILTFLFVKYVTAKI